MSEKGNNRNNIWIHHQQKGQEYFNFRSGRCIFKKTFRKQSLHNCFCIYIYILLLLLLQSLIFDDLETLCKQVFIFFKLPTCLNLLYQNFIFFFFCKYLIFFVHSYFFFWWLFQEAGQQLRKWNYQKFFREWKNNNNIPHFCAIGSKKKK